MSMDKPNIQDVQLRKGWKYEKVSNGVYAIMKHCGGLEKSYPEWLTSPNFEQMPRVTFNNLTPDEAIDVEIVDLKHSFGEIVIWIVETCEGEWRPVTENSFYIKDRHERAMFKMAWG